MDSLIQILKQIPWLPKHKPLFCSSGSGYSELVNDFVVVVIAAAVVVICVVDCGVAVICIGVICVVVVIWGVIVSSVVVCVIFVVVFVDGHFEQSGKSRNTCRS